MGQRNEELLAQAREAAPLTARRGEEGLLLAKAQGCRVYDADNVAYIDLVGGGGANLLGYSNQYLMDAVRRAAALGLASGFHAAAEVELVQLLIEQVPHLASWVLTASESEAWQLILRWSRRDTGRDRIVVFDGNRRGGVEGFHVAAGPPGVTQPLVAGIPAELAQLVKVAPWGDTEAFTNLLGDIGSEIAAVVLDPIAAQFGVIAPSEEFLRTVASSTRAAGARLILDETLTGFRLARGGAGEAFGITPDAAVFGGALGGGVARIGAGAVARTTGAAPLDEVPEPPPPIAVLAAIATLSVLRNESVHQRLEERGAQLQAGIESLAERYGRPLRCSRIGSVFVCYFSRQPVTDGDSFARVDQETWARFSRAARDSGVLLPSRSPVTCFLSHAHGVKDVEQALAAMDAALKKLQKDDEA